MSFSSIKFIPFNHYKYISQTLLCQFYRYGNRCSERLNNLPKVRNLISGREETQMQVLKFYPQSFFYTIMHVPSMGFKKSRDTDQKMVSFSRRGFR